MPHNFSLPNPGHPRFLRNATADLSTAPHVRSGLSRYRYLLYLSPLAFSAITLLFVYSKEYPSETYSVGPELSPAKWEPRFPPIRLHLVQYTVHDADTLTQCQIHLGWDLYQSHRSIRFVGFDAREVSKQRQTNPPVTDTETRLGQQDRDRLAKWLQAGEVFVEPAGMSTDGRRLQGRIFRYRDGQWQDAVEWMRSQGIPERS